MAKSSNSSSPLSTQHFQRVLLSAIHSIHEAVVVTDFEDRLLFANQGFERLTGYKAAEILGHPLYESLLPEDMWEEMRQTNLRRRERQSDLYETELLMADGSSRRIMSRGTPLMDEAGEPIGTVGVLSDIEELRRLQSLRDYLVDETSRVYDTSTIVGESKALQGTLEKARQVAPANTAVLIEGETGTGKELLAHAIHKWSKRRHKPLIKVNCAAIPHELFESEFFGHKKSAFTGATSDKVGRFELAHEGTLFLDEIGELPLEQQGKLLRALQEGEVQRVGENKLRKADVRLVAATNRDLAEEVRAKRFREDLFYRLSVFPLTIPPLRQRTDDIPLLARAFLSQQTKELGRLPLRILEQDIETLCSYSWPGNIRELQNVIERSAILSKGTTLALTLKLPTEGGDNSAAAAPMESTDGPVSDLKATSIHASVSLGDQEMTLEDVAKFEQAVVLRAIKACRGRVYGRDGAARALGLKPSTLQSRLKKWGYTKQWIGGLKEED